MKAISIAVAMIVLVFAVRADARCGNSPRFLTEEYLRGWEVIAFGRVVEAHKDGSAQHNSFAVLKLEGSWQGDPPNPLRVYHSDSVHGYQFEYGELYLVFASRVKDRFVTSICSPTCVGNRCVEQLEILGQPDVRYESTPAEKP